MTFSIESRHNTFMKRIYFLLLALSVFTVSFAQPRDLTAQINEKISLDVGDTVKVVELRIKLVSVNDDGCGTKRECYWSQFRDATFHVWQGDKDLGEITVSRGSREDSIMSVQVGEWYLVLDTVDGYEAEMPSAIFKVTDTALSYTF
jgi:hypothetical protein